MKYPQGGFVIKKLKKVCPVCISSAHLDHKDKRLNFYVCISCNLCDIIFALPCSSLSYMIAWLETMGCRTFGMKTITSIDLRDRSESVIPIYVIHDLS